MNNNDSQPASSLSTRREFIKKASTAAVAVAATNLFKTPVYGQNQAPSPGRVIGANDRIVVGYIGVGNQGMAHVRSQKGDASANNIVQLAVCDLSKHRVNAAKDYIGGDVQMYDDHRKLLENKDIDAVTIATVDHWHTNCAIDSMNAGKHVYVEKPIARYLGEVFRTEKTVKDTGKVLQVGSQICSDARWHKAAELIKAGKIGQMVLAQDSYMRNGLAGEWNYKIEDWCTPEDVNWERWQGEVHNKTEFNRRFVFPLAQILSLLRGPVGRPGAAPVASADAGDGQPGISDARGGLGKQGFSFGPGHAGHAGTGCAGTDPVDCGISERAEHPRDHQHSQSGGSQFHDPRPQGDALHGRQ